jgi:hypothetical protein
VLPGHQQCSGEPTQGLDDQSVVAPSNCALQHNGRIVLAPSRAGRSTVRARRRARSVPAFGAQVGRQERIDPITADRLVHRCDQTRRPSQPLQSVTCLRPIGKRVGRGGRGKQLPVRVREVVENLADQEVRNGPGVHREPGNERVGLGACAQDGSGEAHAGRPAARAGVQPAHLRGRQA